MRAWGNLLAVAAAAVACARVPEPRVLRLVTVDMLRALGSGAERAPD